MNRKSRTAACRSPAQTRPRLLKEYRAPAAAACSHAAAGSTHHARMPSDRELPPPGGPRFAQPGRPTREWSGRLAQTRGQDRQDYVQHGPGRPSVGETPANTVDVFLASAAPPARDSGCPPNRVNPKAQCILVIIGATPEGKKELVGFTDGLRESSQSWRDLLLDLKRRGLTTAPQIAVAKPALAKAGGALGFWKALGEVWPTTREQRCWVHKTANILNKMPKSLHTKAKRALQQIWMAETKKDAVKAFDAFVETYQIKYHRAADCLTKDRDALLAFYDFPAEHWKHLRTTNPIESTFATVRHRTIRSKGCLSNKTALAMVFKLVEAAQKTWRRLDGNNQLPKLILGVKFADGLEVAAKPANREPATVAA